MCVVDFFEVFQDFVFELVYVVDVDFFYVDCGFFVVDVVGVE